MAATLALLALLGCAAGLLIGVTGIGGVVLVPAMTYLGDVPVQVSIAAAMMSYVPTGAVGA